MEIILQLPRSTLKGNIGAHPYVGWMYVYPIQRICIPIWHLILYDHNDFGLKHVESDHDLLQEVHLIIIYFFLIVSRSYDLWQYTM